MGERLGHGVAVTRGHRAGQVADGTAAPVLVRGPPGAEPPCRTRGRAQVRANSPKPDAPTAAPRAPTGRRVSPDAEPLPGRYLRMRRLRAGRGTAAPLPQVSASRRARPHTSSRAENTSTSRRGDPSLNISSRLPAESPAASALRGNSSAS